MADDGGRQVAPRQRLAGFSPLDIVAAADGAHKIGGIVASGQGVASMTGFARAEAGDAQWAWELRSVNARNLDIRCRLPAGLEALEIELRQRIPSVCRRGNVTVQLNPSQNGQRAAGFRINAELVRAYLEAARTLDGASLAPPTLDGILSLPGVIERNDSGVPDLKEADLLRSFDTALAGLGAMRRTEGTRLAAAVAALLDRLAMLHGRAAESAALQPAAVKARLEAQIQPLLEVVPAISEDRLAQEVALIAARADIREELDRLAAHVAAARDLIGEGGPVGRKLDFLCQELNREANTICSKSTDLTLTEIGLELKTTIEQLREQVQNIE
jgi:uncharacterized protein (TIGR00255 family)